MWIIFFVLLVVISIIDAKTRTIPNTLIILAAINRFVWMFIQQEWTAEILQQILFSEIIPILILVSVIIFERFRGTSAMGGGDIKLLIVMALYVSWMQVLITIMIACSLSLIWAFLRKQPDFPFAPALTLGFAFALLV